MPPLMLDRDEAVAVAVSLRAAAGDMVAGGGEAAIRALAKLDQLLPPTLRRQVGALDAMTSRLGGTTSPVDAELLVALTRACSRRRAAARPLPRRPRSRVRAHARSVPPRADATALVPRRPRPRPRRLADVPRRPPRRRRPDRPPRRASPTHPIPWRSCRRRSRRRRTATRPGSSCSPRSTSCARSCRRPSGRSSRSTPRATMLDDRRRRPRVLVFHLAALGVDFVVHEPAELRDEVAAVARRLTAAAARR